MRIYRVEHESTPEYDTILKVQDSYDYYDRLSIRSEHHTSDWRGPYRDLRFCFDHYTSNGRPCPYDSRIEPLTKHIFGFKSLKALFKWFKAEDRVKLRKYDYHIVELDLSDTTDIQFCKAGSGQLCFNPKYAKKVGTRRIAV